MEVEELAVPIIKGNTGGQVDNLTQSRYWPEKDKTNLLFFYQLLFSIFEYVTTFDICPARIEVNYGVIDKINI